MPKILIATPTADTLEARTAGWRESIAHRYRDQVTFANMTDIPAIAIGRPVDFVRNSFIRICKVNDYSHLFLLDSDTEPPMDAIDRLLALNVPLATGCYPVWMQHGLRWALANKDNDRRYWLLDRLPSLTEPFEVDAGGAGCLLIRRDVFDKVNWPWFKWVEFEDGSQESEDIHFFHKCNDVGLRVTVDPQVICNHFKKLNITDLMRMKMQGRNKES